MSTTDHETAKSRPDQGSKRPPHARTSLPAGPDYWPVPAQRTSSRRPASHRGEPNRSGKADSPARRS